MRGDKRSWVLVLALLILCPLSLLVVDRLARLYPRVPQVLAEIVENGDGMRLFLLLIPLLYLLLSLWVLSAYGRTRVDKSHSTFLMRLIERKRTGEFLYRGHRQSQMPRTYLPASLRGTEIMRPGLLGRSVLDHLIAVKRGRH